MAQHRKELDSVIVHWLPLAAAITLICGLIYLSVQQVLRQAANDPQIQMAEDIASQLALGTPIKSFTTSHLIDMKTSLSPYLIIYNQTGQPVLATVQLDGQTPQLPNGVFSYVQSHDEDRFTWQPQPEVRSATVVTRFAGSQSGYVLVGRSLREVENRENQLTNEVAIFWLTTLVISLLLTILSTYL